MAGIWQNIAAVGIVLAAALYLARRAWLRSAAKRPSRCPNPACENCPQSVYTNPKRKRGEA